jgi:hypothetical protein
MFRCSITNRLSRPGDKLHRVVVAIRKREYLKVVLNEETRMKETVLSGSGWEVVKELSCSTEGAELWRAANPDGPKVVEVVSRIDPQ